MKLEEEAYHS